MRRFLCYYCHTNRYNTKTQYLQANHLSAGSGYIKNPTKLDKLILIGNNQLFRKIYSCRCWNNTTGFIHPLYTLQKQNISFGCKELQELCCKCCYAAKNGNNMGFDIGIRRKTFSWGLSLIKIDYEKRLFCSARYFRVIYLLHLFQAALKQAPLQE